MIFNENGVIVNEGLISKVNKDIKQMYIDWDNQNYYDPEKDTDTEKFSDDYRNKKIKLFKTLISKCNTITDYKWVKNKLKSFIRSEKIGKSATPKYINSAQEMIGDCDFKISEIKNNKNITIN